MQYNISVKDRYNIRVRVCSLPPFLPLLPSFPLSLPPPSLLPLSLSRGAKQLITPVLAGLLENDVHKMMTFDTLFATIEQISKKKVYICTYSVRKIECSKRVHPRHFKMQCRVHSLIVRVTL